MGLHCLSLKQRAAILCPTLTVVVIAAVVSVRSSASAGFVPTPTREVSDGKQLTSSRLRQGLRSGYWHTEGNRIVSADHAVVRITGVNWSGLETSAAVPGGLDHQDYHSILQAVSDAGYNTLRIPFSNQVIESPGIPSGIRFENETGPINADLENLNSLQVLDHIVFAASELGLKVILDNHRSEAGSSAEENGLWYTDRYPEEVWIADWVALAGRYRSTPAVVGFDLRNEPHNATSNGACWDCGGARDWHLAAQRAGNAILAVNPNLLVFVEGTDVVEGSSYWWGGNLMGVRRSPVRLSVPNRLVYSAHVYGPTEYQQSWFNVHATPSSLMANFRQKWGYVDESGLAPVWLGEFGAPNDEVSLTSTEPGSEGQWFTSLIFYLRSHPTIGWSYWGLNGEDRYSLLDSHYSGPANPIKSHLLASILHTSPNASLPLIQVPTAPNLTLRALPPQVSATQIPLIAPATFLVPIPDAMPILSSTMNSPTAAVSGSRKGRHSHEPAQFKFGHPADDAIAEQVRVATQQAMRNLPAPQ